MLHFRAKSDILTARPDAARPISSSSSHRLTVSLVPCEHDAPAPNWGGRTLTVYPQDQYQALVKAREQQETDEFREQYAARAGIEGTISQATRTMKVRRSRYIGLDRTRLQHVATAAAINVSRLANWLQGERPAPTRPSPFLELAAKMT